MNRRKLLSWVGLGWLVSLLPSSLVGCSGTDSSNVASTESATESADAASAKGFKVVGTVAQLDKDGVLARERVAVVRDPRNPKNLLAVNASCTHNGCTVKWQKNSKEYVCPCHDAKFAADGAVRQGPASTPLPRLAAKIDKGNVLVSG